MSFNQLALSLKPTEDKLGDVVQELFHYMLGFKYFMLNLEVSIGKEAEFEVSEDILKELSALIIMVGPKSFKFRHTPSGEWERQSRYAPLFFALDERSISDLLSVAQEKKLAYTRIILRLRESLKTTTTRELDQIKKIYTLYEKIIFLLKCKGITTSS